MSQVRVGIINVTGYAGVELARLLYRHPEVKLISVTGRSAAGQRLAEVFPHLAEIDITITPELDEVDVAFSAMPHKASAEVILPLAERGIKVVDISADFRLKDASKYPEWYDFAHPAPDLLQKAVYGLPEFHRSEIAKASLVANPGCYPTGALLALAPAVKKGLVHPDIIVDAKSGVSGAGRTLSLSTHYTEAVDNVRAYSLHGHRHLPEIIQELETLNPSFSFSVTFLPHLMPTSRGILSSCYARLNDGKLANEKVRELYRDYYKGEPFVRVVDSPPETKQTWGSNLCLIYPTVDHRTGRLIAISCLDNLVKGAAGQAIQNMNIMFSFPETAGLEALPIYP
ncbi:MAG: N-acetyl-gamma-glutamyl-phosphate reductase [Chloroflexi bacterium]|nr:N-acetyl-gamma-glutamyl-phosphate reductase [Chloroflexota bacterium]